MKRQKTSVKNDPLPFAVMVLSIMMAYYVVYPLVLSDWKVFLATGKGFLALSTEIFIFGIAVRKNIALDHTSVTKLRGFTTSYTRHICFRDGGSSGSQNILLHVRHQPFFSVSEREWSPLQLETGRLPRYKQYNRIGRYAGPPHTRCGA